MLAGAIEMAMQTVGDLDPTEGAETPQPANGLTFAESFQAHSATGVRRAEGAVADTDGRDALPQLRLLSVAPENLKPMSNATAAANQIASPRNTKSAIGTHMPSLGTVTAEVANATEKDTAEAIKPTQIVVRQTPLSATDDRMSGDDVETFADDLTDSAAKPKSGVSRSGEPIPLLKSATDEASDIKGGFNPSQVVASNHKVPSKHLDKKDWNAKSGSIYPNSIVTGGVTVQDAMVASPSTGGNSGEAQITPVSKETSGWMASHGAVVPVREMPHGPTLKNTDAEANSSDSPVPLAADAVAAKPGPQPLFNGDTKGNGKEVSALVETAASSGSGKIPSILPAAMGSVFTGPVGGHGGLLQTKTAISASTRTAEMERPIASDHQMLLATPKMLEVGMANGTAGWLKIRAEIGENGAVTASLAAASHTGTELLRRDLPALNLYLAGEHIPVQASVTRHSHDGGAASAERGWSSGASGSERERGGNANAGNAFAETRNIKESSDVLFDAPALPSVSGESGMMRTDGTWLSVRV